MPNSKLFSFCLPVIALAAIHPLALSAGSITTTTPAYYHYTASVGATNAGCNACSGPGTASVGGVSVAVAASPGGSVTADIGGVSGLGSGLIDYYFEYFGPASSTLPLWIDARLDVFASASANGYASAHINTPDGNVTINCFGQNGCNTNPSANELHFNDTLKGTISANTEYQIEIYAGVSTGSGGSQSEHAFVDPLIYLDPAFASAGSYTFQQSAGISNGQGAAAPEPGTALLLLAGLALMLFAGTRPSQKRVNNQHDSEAHKA